MQDWDNWCDEIRRNSYKPEIAVLRIWNEELIKPHGNAGKVTKNFSHFQTTTTEKTERMTEFFTRIFAGQAITNNGPSGFIMIRIFICVVLNPAHFLYLWDETENIHRHIDCGWFLWWRIWGSHKNAFQQVWEWGNSFLFERVLLNEEAIKLADSYISANVVGKTSLEDCRHIALATIIRVDILSSWNFKHIVNLDRIKGYNSVNLRLGYPILEIRSPKDLIKYEND